MFRTTAITILLIGCLLTAINAGVLILQLSGSSKAAVAGMNAQSLAGDADFKRAVQDIVEACRVNVDIAKVKC
jgi:hypothetical protein